MYSFNAGLEGSERPALSREARLWNEHPGRTTKVATLPVRFKGPEVRCSGNSPIYIRGYK